MKRVDKKKRFVFVFSLVFLVIANTGLGLSDVSTLVEIANSPPMLVTSIPDQFWPANESLLDAFNLNDYFVDPNGDSLIFNSSSVQNITIFISSNGSVSFFPDISFIGLRNITFSCSDGKQQTNSNLVSLNVGFDNEAPKWYFPEKTKSVIYQNSVLNFSTIWTDNLRLKESIFSINQGAGWVNYSSYAISGIYNTSRADAVQISAPGGTNVSWRFYAFDSIMNMNVTDVQYFLVSSLPTGSVGSGSDSGGTGSGEGSGVEGSLDDGSASYEKDVQKTVKDFSLDFSYVVISLYSGEGMTKVLKITNIGTSNLSFNLFDQNLANFLTLSETSFNLAPSQTESVTLEFTFPDNFSVEQYFGFLVINSSAGLKKIPIVLNLKQKNSDLGVSVNLSEKDLVVKPGKDVHANIFLVFPKDTERDSLILYYAIKDISGNVVDSAEERVDLSSQEVERALNVPSEASLGEYIFYARLSNKNKLAIDSQIFEVGSRIKLAAFLKYGSFFLIISLVSILILSLFYLYNQKKQRARVLRLYLLLNELKGLVKAGEYDDAIELYLKIKREYNEDIPASTIANKETLKDEIKKISEYLNKKEPLAPEPEKKEDESTKEDTKKESSGEDEEKKGAQ